MSKFGWSLPPGCSTLPGEEPEPVQPRCDCGAYLLFKPDSVEPWEETEECTGAATVLADGFLIEPACGDPRPHAPHRFVVAAGGVMHWTCRKCSR